MGWVTTEDRLVTGQDRRLGEDLTEKCCVVQGVLLVTESGSSSSPLVTLWASDSILE